MKKMAALFTESMREFRNIRTITACGLFAALALILNSFTVQIGNYLKIGVSGLPNEMVDVLFGPAVGSLFAAAMDILKLLLYPTGAWIPGLTLNCLLAGLIYGFFLYRKPTNFWRILAAELTVALLVNVLLGTFWLSQVYGKAFALKMNNNAIAIIGGVDGPTSVFVAGKLNSVLVSILLIAIGVVMLIVAIIFYFLKKK